MKVAGAVLNKMAPVPQRQDTCTTITDIREGEGEEDHEADLSPEELTAWASSAMQIPETDTKVTAYSSKSASGGNVLNDTDRKEGHNIDEALSPEELVAAASSAAIQSPGTGKHLEQNSKTSFHRDLSADGEDCAGAVLIRRRSSGAPQQLFSLNRDSQVRMPGAFRAGSSVMYDEENAVLEDEEFAANETSGMMNNDQNSNEESDQPTSAESLSSVPLEATLVVTTDEEPIRAEPLLSPSNSMDSKGRRRKRLMVTLLVSAILTVLAGSVILTTIFLTNKEGQDTGENESEIVFVRVESNDSSSSDPRGATAPLSETELLETYDRITHHAAIFQWKIPTRCSLEPESTAWLDEPFFMVECGSGYGSNSSLVLYDGQTKSAKCTRREAHSVGCKTLSKATTDSSQSESYGALVLFSCGTFSRDYNNSNASAGRITQTAQIRVEKTEAYCGAQSDADDEDEIQIVLSLERICRSSDSVSTVLPSSICRSDEIDDDEVSDDLLYNLSDKACCRKGPPCQPDGKDTFCHVDYHAFSAVDELGDTDECQFKSLEEREELFQNAVTETLQAVADLPELEQVEALIPLR